MEDTIQERMASVLVMCCTDHVTIMLACFVFGVKRKKAEEMAEAKEVKDARDCVVKAFGPNVIQVDWSFHAGARNYLGSNQHYYRVKVFVRGCMIRDESWCTFSRVCKLTFASRHLAGERVKVELFKNRRAEPIATRYVTMPVKMISSLDSIPPAQNASGFLIHSISPHSCIFDYSMILGHAGLTSMNFNWRAILKQENGLDVVVLNTSASDIPLDERVFVNAEVLLHLMPNTRYTLDFKLDNACVGSLQFKSPPLPSEEVKEEEKDRKEFDLFAALQKHGLDMERIQLLKQIGVKTMSDMIDLLQDKESLSNFSEEDIDLLKEVLKSNA